MPRHLYIRRFSRSVNRSCNVRQMILQGLLPALRREDPFAGLPSLFLHRRSLIDPQWLTIQAWHKCV